MEFVSNSNKAREPGTVLYDKFQRFPRVKSGPQTSFVRKTIFYFYFSLIILKSKVKRSLHEKYQVGKGPPVGYKNIFLFELKIGGGVMIFKKYVLGNL